MKKCSRCQEVKSLEDFHNASNTKDGKTSRCKACNVEYQREWAIKNPERAKARWKKYAAEARSAGKDRARKHRLATMEYLELVSRANCEICGRSFTEAISHIDHNHETGQVRGLLCTNCNTGIGNLRDDPILLQKAIDYLAKYASLAQSGSRAADFLTVI